MKENIVFGTKEASSLLINILYIKIFTSSWQVLAATSANASWIAIVYKYVWATIFFAVVMALYKKFEGSDLLDITRLTLGRWGMVIIGVLFFFYTFLNGYFYYRVFIEFIKSTVLQYTPPHFTVIFVIAIAVFGAMAGLSVLGKFAAYAVPIILSVLALLILMLSNKFNTLNLFPILGNGAKELFVTEFYRLSMFSEIGLLFFVTPYLKKERYVNRVGYKTLFYSFVALLVTNLAYLLMVEVPESTYYTMPMYYLSGLIKVGYLFQRLEGFFVLVWIMASYLYIALMLYFAAYIFKRTFALKHQNPIILLLAWFMAAAELIFIEKFPDYLGYVPFLSYGLVFFPGIPMLVMIIAHLRGVKNESYEK